MANVKKITKVEALNTAIELADGNAELVEKLTTMRDAEIRKAEKAKERAKNGEPTAEQIKNRNRALKAVKAIADAGNEPRTVAWISEHVTDMLTPQKVSGTMGIVMREGLVAYGAKVKGKVTYQVTDAGMAVLAEL